MTRDKRRPRLTLQHLWGLAALVSVFAFTATHPIRPHDFWWHAAVGREIVATGAIPRVDAYSQAMRGAPYAAYQVFWLMDVALYALYSAGGAALVVFTHAVAITAAYALLLDLGRRQSGSWRIAAFATLFAAALGLNDWNVRPQAVTFAIAALFLWAARAHRARPRPALLALYPVGMAVWVNSHGTFPIGLLLVGLWLLDELWGARREVVEREWVRAWGRVRPPLIALSLAALACLLNPQGLGIHAYLRGMGGNPIVQNLVPEWAPPSFDTLTGGIFLIGLLGAATVLILSPRRPTPAQLVTFLAFGLLGLQTRRGAVWFGLTMAPVLADHLAALAREARGARPAPATSGTPALTYATAALLLLGALVSLPWFKAWLPLPGEKAELISPETPVAATEYLLEHHLPAPLFHEISFGSYLIWAAQPEYRVFVDSRIELYPPELWFDYIAVAGAQANWEEVLEKRGIETLMVSPTAQARLVAEARESPRWEQVYEDEAAVILRRRAP
jgi:hypothetical protein